MPMRQVTLLMCSAESLCCIRCYPSVILYPAGQSGARLLFGRMLSMQACQKVAGRCCGVCEVHLQEEGEPGVSVGDVLRQPAALRLHQQFDDPACTASGMQAFSGDL